MSKRDELKFSVKKSLVVGTATAAISAAGCGGISNPVPNRDVDYNSDVQDTMEKGDAGTDGGETIEDGAIVNPVPEDVRPDDTASDDASSDTDDGGATDTTSDDTSE